MFTSKVSAPMPMTLAVLTCFVMTILVPPGFAGQSGKALPGGRRTATLNVIVRGPKNKAISKDIVDLYDSGIPQEIDSFTPLEVGSRIVLMVDNSSNLRADLNALQKAAESLVSELYEDDQMMVVGFNESADIIEDLTPELAKLKTATTKFIRKGFPKLFDALVAVADALAHQASTGIEKRAIILISDGYDSESQTKFEPALNALQDENIVLYALQVQDRTRGALLRDKPKPPAVLEQLTVGTGGLIFPFDKTADSAKAITDDLRNNWYRLTYTPTGVNTLNTRRLLLISHDPKVEFRTKGSQPGRYRADSR
ncbi:MAG TPA: VWA domain-containing protein [Blastocatellia bacterium]|nr:VWA domain-containing protein [Blastocatellia bacterium]